MFTVALLTIAKKWKQSKCPSAGEWTNKIQYIIATEYYLAIKRNEVQIHTTTQGKLENITVNERNQAQKTTYYVIQLNEMPKLEDGIYRDRK